jgi:hypothetical protein
VRFLRCGAGIWSSGKSGGLAYRQSRFNLIGRDGLYTFGCIPQRFESALANILRYIKTLIYFICLMCACTSDPTIFKFGTRLVRCIRSGCGLCVCVCVCVYVVFCGGFFANSDDYVKINITIFQQGPENHMRS